MAALCDAVEAVRKPRPTEWWDRHAMITGVKLRTWGAVHGRFRQAVSTPRHGSIAALQHCSESYVRALRIGIATDACFSLSAP